MPVDIATVKQVAYLARLKVPDSDLEKVAEELDSLCEWAEHLKQVNTDGVEPLTSVLDKDMPLIYRQDEVSDGNKQEELMKCAKVSADGFYVVPRMVE
ncbi:MAG: Asp-tRNA(Asn)/Glu-tRNA(Gln) amidotransferase subunit GatC [Alphaproteobacteria bacterium]|nr:Asp-tRNA(Asn)/Glu-tRNA(Gln) amidotransferase subunit GatC [Alphaproteobacteria bacterium]